MNKNVKLKNNDIITIQLSDTLDEIIFYKNEDKLDGEFEFKETRDNEYLVTRMYVPENYKRLGLGTEVLKFFKEISECEILYTRPNDGIVREDGSHLTEDAPNFVNKMIEENIINRPKDIEITDYI